MQYDNDYVLCECELGSLVALVTELENTHTVTMVREPSVCLTMVRAEDSLEKQEFCLGEALSTDCEVLVDNTPGYGICLGEERVRGYCLAVIDALQHQKAPSLCVIERFLERHREIIAERERQEFNLILRTQVDFKLMEEED